MPDPFTRDDLQRVLDQEVGGLDAEHARHYHRHRIEPTLASLPMWNETFEPTFVVAQCGREVLYYDDIEEEFGTGVLDSTGVIRDAGTWGRRLEWALRRFPRSG